MFATAHATVPEALVGFTQAYASPAGNHTEDGPDAEIFSAQRPQFVREGISDILNVRFVPASEDILTMLFGFSALEIIWPLLSICL